MLCLGCGFEASADLNNMCRPCYYQWAWRSDEFARHAKVVLAKAKLSEVYREEDRSAFCSSDRHVAIND